MFRTEFRYFPAGDITMDTVKKSCICSHFRRERIKQAGGLQKHVHALIDISHENHRSGSCLFLLATGKGTGRHIVLHNLDAIFILKMDSGHFIKGHTVPKAHKSNRLSSHIIKQIGNRGLSARYQNAIRRDFLIEMGFSGASRSQFAKIKIILHKWKHTGKKQPLFPLCQGIRLHTNGTKHYIHPLFFSKRFTSLL